LRCGKRGTLLAMPRAALTLAMPLCGTILADWMPNRDILVDWPGQSPQNRTVLAKTGRMVCLSVSSTQTTLLTVSFCHNHLWSWFSVASCCTLLTACNATDLFNNNWRQAGAWIVLFVRAVRVNTLAQGALRQVVSGRGRNTQPFN